MIAVVIAALPLAAQGRRPTRPQVARPDGETWNVIRKNCTRCHGIDDYAFYALDGADWNSEANAGLENLPLSGADLPYVIKSPWISECVE